MSHTLFADTSAFFAAFSEADARHPVALSALTGQTSLVTTRLIVIETVSLMTKRLSSFHAHAWHETIVKNQEIRVREVEADVLAASEKLWKQNKDKNWDLIDCYSFSVMRQERLMSAWSFDQHFIQAGFQLLPGFVIKGAR